jgi:hypothetical protein
VERRAPDISFTAKAGRLRVGALSTGGDSRLTITAEHQTCQRLDVHHAAPAASGEWRFTCRLRDDLTRSPRHVEEDHDALRGVSDSADSPGWITAHSRRALMALESHA